ncbi:hypothetical protein RND81_13G012000 [Saponaria officinalis]|uniref:Myb-like domain-containing protein n=1 Tax=Saponaria officinalis TaxID=3572 RepID=A0AAW1GVV1_SAPOF
MAQKRPYDEVVSEVSSKHQRQDGPAVQITSHNDGFSKETDILKLPESGETNALKRHIEYRDNCENYGRPENRHEGEETVSDASRSASLSHWATIGPCDEDEPPDETLHFPFFSGYFSFDRPVRSAINHPDDVYHCLLDYPPRKQVPIGSEHQAEIPSLGENTSKENSGINLETEPPEPSILKVGAGRLDCQCQDHGSVRCVQLHIAEARDKLRRALGEDAFVELGFNNMGEVVAEKWTNDEEQLFVKVVYENPVSSGGNFWNALSAIFPSRTKMEIVSYYFNVFMLRKRAEQNRCDQMSIDSDNDEWQGSDSDDDDDSGIESPSRNDGLVFRQNELLIHEHEEDDGNVSDDARETDVKNSQGIIRDSNTDPALELPRKKFDDGADNDARDGSCTSSDSGASAQVTQIKSDDGREWREYILDSTDSTDAKAWDGYLSCPKTNVDFLPTCSMIEEVFGGDIDSKNTRQ